jgi:hypothetical protein
VAAYAVQLNEATSTKLNPAERVKIFGKVAVEHLNYNTNDAFPKK